MSLLPPHLTHWTFKWVVWLAILVQGLTVLCIVKVFTVRKHELPVISFYVQFQLYYNGLLSSTICHFHTWQITHGPAGRTFDTPGLLLWFSWAITLYKCFCLIITTVTLFLTATSSTDSRAKRIYSQWAASRETFSHCHQVDRNSYYMECDTLTHL